MKSGFSSIKWATGSILFLIFLNYLPILFSVTGAIDNKSEKHEYHSISDNEDDDFFKPLDLGPSLMDEVFSELGSPNRLVHIIISSQLIFAKLISR